MAILALARVVRSGKLPAVRPLLRGVRGFGRGSTVFRAGRGAVRCVRPPVSLPSGTPTPPAGFATNNNNSSSSSNERHNTPATGSRLLRDLLSERPSVPPPTSAEILGSEDNETNDDHSGSRSTLLASWKHAEDVLRSSLRELRALRTRAERGALDGISTNSSSSNNNNNNDDDAIHEKDALIVDCLRLLDRLSDSLPRAEDYSSSWLFQAGKGSLAAGAESAAAASVLDRDLLNELLKEWMMGWKARQQKQPVPRQSSSPLLPGPSEIAEKVDNYRSTCLVQPDPTSFNLLLNAMVHGGGGKGNINTNAIAAPTTGDRTKAVRLADNYLRRLLKVQRQQGFGNHAATSLVDIVSVTTVMKGWVELGRPEKAQDWLDFMEKENHDDGLASTVRPNAVAYATAAHGWAGRGEALRAESVLHRAVEHALHHSCSRSGSWEMEDETHGTTPDGGGGGDVMEDGSHPGVPVLDRVVFHAVLDAWAAKAAVGARNQAVRPNKPPQEHETESVVPAVRARELVRAMEDLAESHPSSLGHLTPSDETWHKLIAVVASSQQQPRQRKQKQKQLQGHNDNDETGPEAAERLLVELETGHRYTTTTTTPAVLLNRILRAYCVSGTRMEEAEAFYHRRCELRAEDGFCGNGGDSSTGGFPNEVTFHTILTGWAEAARVAGKRKRKPPKRKSHGTTTEADIPLRAEAWLDEMLEQHEDCCRPSTRSYGSVLQAWSLSVRHHENAADRAENLLRKRVWPLLREGSEGAADPTGVVICTNIALRAWSNQAAAAAGVKSHGNSEGSTASRSVGKCLRLLHDFLSLAREVSHGVGVKPTEGTFRPVLHAILSPSNGMTPVQKHDRALTLMASMKDTYNLRPGKADLAKIERLGSRKEAYQKRRHQQQQKQRQQKQRG